MRKPVNRRNAVVTQLVKTDEKFEALYSAVDDYLYSEVQGKGYPEGHCNPRYLEALRQAFLEATK